MKTNKTNYVVKYWDTKGIVQRDLVSSDSAMGARAWVLWNRAIRGIISSVPQK